jgi:hypothetical protein
LPTKADLARMSWTLANTPHMLAEDRMKALRLYADIMGFISKPETTINNNILTSNKVMVVRDHGEDNIWEDKLLTQQTRLLDDAAASEATRH